ncbi:MAG: M48 family metallopeptidase [Alphaproteobacteria bacterium]
MPIVMDRRRLVAGLAAGSVVAFTGGCAQNTALGRKQLLLVDDAQLAQLSAASWKQIREKEKISRDPELNARVRRVGQRIAAASGLPRRDWEFTVFDSDAVNAFVLPGGKVGFYRGILELMANDDQVATVMGHEFAHLAGRHSAERYSQQLASNSALQVTDVVLASNDVQFAREISAVLGAGVTFGVILPYSRRHEYEADRIGMGYMAKAGYDLDQAVAFWEKMAARSKGSRPEFASTHPSDQNRIRAIREEIGRIRA